MSTFRVKIVAWTVTISPILNSLEQQGKPNPLTLQTGVAYRELIDTTSYSVKIARLERTQSSQE